MVNTILLLPFGGLVIKFINKIIKQNKNSDEDDNRLLYLDDRIVDTPTMASISIHQELGHLADKTYRNLERALESFSKQSEDMAEKVFSEEKSINYIASEIVRFLVKLQAMTEISDTERLEIFRVHEVVSNIERIGDHAENIAEYTLDCKMNDSNSPRMLLDDLWDIAEHAKQAYSAAIKVIKGEGHEEEERRLCWENEDMVDKLRDEMKEKHIRRLAKESAIPLWYDLYGHGSRLRAYSGSCDQPGRRYIGRTKNDSKLKRALTALFFITRYTRHHRHCFERRLR